MSDVTSSTQATKKFDPEAFAMNLARAMESSGQALAAYLNGRQGGELRDNPPTELTEVVKTFTAVAEYWLSDNERAAELQKRIGRAYIDLWGSSLRRLDGYLCAHLSELFGRAGVPLEYRGGRGSPPFAARCGGTCGCR